MKGKRRMNSSMEKGIVVLSVLFSVLLVWTVPTHALEAVAGQELPDDELCKYVKRGPPGITSSSQKPLLFANVKGVYLWVQTDQTLKQNPILQWNSMSRLARCVVVGRLIQPKFGHHEPDIPVEILPAPAQHSRSGGHATWPEADVPGNLIVWVTVKQVQGQEGLALLQARFYRPDVNHVSSMRPQCAHAFSYTDDIDETLRALTGAMGCLRGPYHDAAVEKPAIDKSKDQGE